MLSSWSRVHVSSDKAPTLKQFKVTWGFGAAHTTITKLAYIYWLSLHVYNVLFTSLDWQFRIDWMDIQAAILLLLMFALSTGVSISTLFAEWRALEDSQSWSPIAVLTFVYLILHLLSISPVVDSGLKLQCFSTRGKSFCPLTSLSREVHRN